MAEAKSDKKPARARTRRGSRFDVADDVPDTRPAAGTGRLSVAPAPAPAPARPVAREKPAKAAKTSAFTWRRTSGQVIKMDEMTIRLKRELEMGRIDHATILDALVDVAAENDVVFGALAAKIQERDS